MTLEITGVHAKFQFHSPFLGSFDKVISRFSRGISFFTFILCTHLFAQSPTILSSSVSELTFRIVFPDPFINHNLENEYFTIGLPTADYPELNITLIKTVNLTSSKASGQFYSPASGYGEWVRLDKFRNLNVATLRLSPTLSESSKIVALELEVKIRFPESLSTRISISRPETLIYRHRILNWSVAKNWLAHESLLSRINNKSDLRGDWYKITISEDGVYGVTGATLTEAGMDIANINPASMRIFTNLRGGRPIKETIGGPIPENLKEIAFRISGGDDGTIDNTDKLIFYARGPRGFDTNNKSTAFTQNPYTNLNVYWLNIPLDPDIQGLRIDTANNNFDQPVVINYGIAYAHFESDELNPFESGLLWVGPGVTKQQTLSAPIKLHHPRKDISAQAEISLFGGTSSGEKGYPSHAINIQQRSLSDSVLSRQSWTGKVNRDLSLNLDENLLNHGSNFFLATNMTTDDLSKVFIDWISVRYGSELIWEGTQFDYWAPSNLNLVRFMIANVNSDIAVWDISDIHMPLDQVIVISGNNGYFEQMLSSNGVERFIVYDIVRTLEVDSITKIDNQNFTTFRTEMSGIDHIILSPESFLDPAKKLSEHRDFSIVVPLQAIYDEFAGGVSDPRAIRYFLKWVKSHWSGSSGSGFPAYVLLMGDGDYDYRNISGNSINFIPTFQSEILGITSSDDKFTYLDGQSPEMAIGRLPASTVDEALIMVEKIIAYEKEPEIGLWRRRISLIADDFSRPNFGALELSHTKNSEEIAGMIPRTMEVRKLYMEDFSEINDGSQYGITKPGASEALFDLLNEGTVLLNYIGHGSAYQWAQEGLLSAARGDLASIETGNRLPIWLAATCSWGQYDKVEGSAMSEDILRAPGNAGVAIISTNGLITFSANRSFIIKLFQSFFPDTTISDLSLGAIYSSIKDGSRGSQMFHLLGDPALRLALPSQNAEIHSVTPDTLTALQTGTYRGNLSGITPKSGLGFVTLTNADRTITRNYKYQNYTEDVTYTIPGNTLFRGKLAFSDRTFEGSFILPKDISNSTRGKLSVYLYGYQGDDLWEGLGLKEGLIFKGGTNNPMDQQGPLVSFGLEKRTIETGDHIPEGGELLISLSDPLGINITGEIGHGIRIWFSDNEVEAIDLTDGFVYNEGSYTSGFVKFSLSDVLPGETNITAEAWDNANNAAKKSVILNITSDEVLKLTNVFNYPNPFRDKTQFGFEVNKEATVEISIFTIAGELIAEIEPLELFYGYSHINWDGQDHYGDVIANGVYLYQITAFSVDGQEKSNYIGKAAKYR